MERFVIVTVMVIVANVTILLNKDKKLSPVTEIMAGQFMRNAHNERTWDYDLQM